MPFTRLTTIQTAATSADLVTLSAVKAALGVKGTAEDADLRRLIASESDDAAGYCNRVFVVETVTDEFWPTGDCLLAGAVAPLQLSRWPVISISSVVENGVTLVDGNDFRVDVAKGLLHRLDWNGLPCAWPACRIAVTHTGGFTQIPARLQKAVIRMIKASRLARDRDPSLRQQNIPGVIEQTWWIATGGDQGNVTPDIADILEDFRVPVVA